MYLGLEVYGSQFTRDIRRTLLKNIRNLLSSVPLRGYHSLRRGIPANFGLASEEVTESTTPHLPIISYKDSVCPLPLSIAFTYGISFDFSSCGY